MLAVTVNEYEPAGTELNIVIIPFDGMMLTPVGAPVNENVIGVVPVAMTVNVPLVPNITLVLPALVISGATGAGVTVSVKLWLAVPAVLVAITVKLYVPGVNPGSVVIRPLELIVTPVGSEPSSVNVGAGKPVAVTWKSPPLTGTLLLLTLVMVGANVTVRLNV